MTGGYAKRSIIRRRSSVTACVGSAVRTVEEFIWSCRIVLYLTNDMRQPSLFRSSPEKITMFLQSIEPLRRSNDGISRSNQFSPGCGNASSRKVSRPQRKFPIYIAWSESPSTTVSGRTTRTGINLRHTLLYIGMKRRIGGEQSCHN